MRKFLEAKITGIEPGAGYMDALYDQTVLIELPDGKQIGLFDSVIMKATPDMIGKNKNIVILVPVSNIKKIHKTEPRIEPSYLKPLSYKGHVYYGKIEKIGVKDEWHNEFKYKNLVSVNVGVGEILVDFDKERLKMIEAGDYVQIYALRTDLNKIL